MKQYILIKYFRNLLSYAFIACLGLYGVTLTAQTQSPSIQSGVTFQWSDTQNGNNDNAATIQSVTVNGEVYNTFVVPTSYQLTRLGRGNGAGSASAHNANGVILNGSQVIGTSTTATLNVNDSTPWDDAALLAFRDQNLNHYFTANPNGENICNNFGAAVSTLAQKQTIFYDPAIPSNTDGILAVTERGGNNCFYVEMYGTPVGGGPEQKLGETFVRNVGDYRGGTFMPPVAGSDYWGSGREQDNGQTIAIALFPLDNIAPTGSKITRIEFIAATRDHGDGKFFILQQYAVDSQETGCINESFDGNIDLTNNVPDNSTYSLVSGPTPAGDFFVLNPDGTYTYDPVPGFVGAVTFEYEVCLPAPNTGVCDQATVTLNFVQRPDAPELDLNCNTDNTTDIVVLSPVGSQYEYALDGGAFQASPTFTGLGEGTYEVTVRDTFSNCINENVTTVEIQNISVVTPVDVTPVSCFGGSDGAINLEPTGGMAPFTYLWSNGATTEDLSNLGPGVYTVMITDSFGCTFETSATVTAPNAALTIEESLTDVDCNNETSGAIDLTVNGGTPPYTYLWSNGATTEDLTGIAAGGYSVTVTDARGCVLTENLTVSEPEAISINISRVDATTSQSCSDGEATATPTGGVAPFTYLWSASAGSQTTQTATNLDDSQPIP